MASKPLLRNRDLALYLGLGLWLAGSVLLYDAYNARGRDKPWPLRVAGVL